MPLKGKRSLQPRPFWIACLVLGLVLVFVPFLLSPVVVSLITLILINAIFAMSLNLILGYTGLYSFGHAAFWGVGAYTMAILAARFGVQNFWITLVAGVLAAMVLAMLFGIIVLRTSRVYFLMLTFALGQIMYGIALKWRGISGGSDGMSILRPSLGLPWVTGSSTDVYFLILVFFVFISWALHRIVNSQLGHTLVGIRENEERMKSLGYNIWLYKYVAYVIAGAIGGVAGCLLIYFQPFVSPNELHWFLSGEVMIMVIIGGAGTYFGPVVGALVVLLLKYIISGYTAYWPLIVGTIFVLIVMYYPRGISPFLLEYWNKLKGLRGLYVRAKS